MIVIAVVAKHAFNPEVEEFYGKVQGALEKRGESYRCLVCGVSGCGH
jgi:hypothetical protein